jgi:hypothetical protein
VKGESKTKTIFIVGIIWAGVCLIILLLNHYFHRHHISKSDRQDATPQVSVKMHKSGSVTQLTSKNNVKMVATNLSVSPKTGKITSPIGEVKLESYQRPKTAKTIKKTPPDQDIMEE